MHERCVVSHHKHSLSIVFRRQTFVSSNSSWTWSSTNPHTHHHPPLSRPSLRHGDQFSISRASVARLCYTRAVEWREYRKYLEHAVLSRAASLRSHLTNSSLWLILQVYHKSVGSSRYFSYLYYMIELIKHTLGICGEPHPSLLTLLLGTSAISYIYYKIKSYGKHK